MKSIEQTAAEIMTAMRVGTRVVRQAAHLFDGSPQVANYITEKFTNLETGEEQRVGIFVIDEDLIEEMTELLDHLRPKANHVPAEEDPASSDPGRN